jgi:pimeloyl-ACP methyl ester carboxylesterase
MKKIYLMITVSIFCCSSLFVQASSAVQANTLISPTQSIYSEYYSNPDSKFKGTIIFEAGGTNDSQTWKQAERNQKSILSCIQTVASTFIYDRPGLGKSTPDYSLSSTNPIDVEKINNDLLQVLDKRHIPGPYIMISHSQGGLYAQYFIRKYPKQFVGAVFIDAMGAMHSAVPKSQQKQVDIWVNAAKTHTADYMYDIGVSNKYTLSERHKSADVAYVVLGLKQIDKKIKALATMPNIPLIVLYSSQETKEDPLWLKEQYFIADQSNKSKLFEVSSGHYIYQEQPKLVCNYVSALLVQLNKEKI